MAPLSLLVMGCDDASERCNGLDDNCDGSVPDDDDDSAGRPTAS
jgi:hypothetical protein